jgi:hypothetical protein
VSVTQCVPRWRRAESMRQAALEWIAGHADQPPASLRARVEAVLTAAPAETTAHDELLHTGREMLGDLLAQGRTARDTALDLLTADALVTYAFEQAADAPASLEARAASAMRAISSVVDAGVR